MDYFTRWFACLLVAFLGLVSPSAFAVTLDTNSQALQACIARSDSFTGSFSNTTSTIQSDEVYRSKCVFNPVTNDRYSCIYILDVTQTRLSDGQTSDFHYAGFCDGNPPAGHNQRPGNRQAIGEAAEPWYANYVPISGSGNTVSCQREYVFCFGENSCSNEVEFDSTTIRAPTPNGTGTVCYDSCQHVVSVWYHGTYPAGELVYTFSPTGDACAPTDEQPEPIPNDDLPEDIDPDEPLDLDPEDGGVDKPVDPGSGRDQDGHGSSSGGGSCDAPPACTGESIQCNILFQTWSTRCAISGGENGNGNGEGGENPWDGKTQDPSDTDVSRFISDEVIDGADFLDSSGMGLSRSCPQLDNYQLTVFGRVIDIDFMPRFCAATSWIGPFMVLLGTYLGILAFLRAK